VIKNPFRVGKLFAALIFGFSGSCWPKAVDFGEMAYRISCADCHGIDGKGNGPMAARLEAKPTDLTVETKKNNGEFRFEAVYDIIDGRRSIAASNPRHMPVWGQTFWA
jgi:mono/diheme cytochrome c family protein